jgi:predicted alpha/beta-fold hydrolase
LLSLYLFYDTNGFHFGERIELDVQIKPGLYYDETNPLINKTISLWPLEKRTYQGTPWMYTGDARTGLPFFLQWVPNIEYKRVFLPTSDGEWLALDFAFPPEGHRDDKPVYLVLCGVNGGSQEEYVKDLVLRRTRAGSTVVVMVSRGLMDLPIQSWNIFHGARTSDAHETATALKRVLAPNQLLVGVGYSMGAIVLGNYVGRSGADCQLDAAFIISGALECRIEQNYERPKRLWQPMIADLMRKSQHLPKWARRMQKRLTNEEMIRMMRATNVVEIDQYIAVAYNEEFRDVEHYYSEMGLLGDIPLNNLELPANYTKSARVFNVSVPLGVLHSLDDPISTWRTIVGNKGMMRPEELVRVGHGNIVLLLTRVGGHVGWPTGWISTRYNWEFMSEACASFAEAVAHAKADLVESSSSAA